MGLFRDVMGALGGGAAAIPEIDAATARQWHESGDCVLIDVREEAEFRAEHIPGTHLAPLSRLEQALPDGGGKKAVFFCRSGARTRMQAHRLAGCGFAETYILGGGIFAWKAAGFPTRSR